MADQGESSRSTTQSPVGAGTYDPTTGVATANVDYAKSFHLRFAGNSTVRKQRPKVRRRRREDDADETDSEEEDVDLIQGAAEDVSESADARDTQETRMKLSEREYYCRCYTLISIRFLVIIFPWYDAASEVVIIYL